MSNMFTDLITMCLSVSHLLAPIASRLVDGKKYTPQGFILSSRPRTGIGRAPPQSWVSTVARSIAWPNGAGSVSKNDARRSLQNAKRAPILSRAGSETSACCRVRRGSGKLPRDSHERRIVASAERGASVRRRRTHRGIRDGDGVCHKVFEYYVGRRQRTVWQR